MKLNRSIYFSVFFLASFLVSFSINTFQSLSFKKPETISSTNKVIFSNFQSPSISVNDFLFEENENEEEGSFNTLISIVPVLVPFNFTYTSKIVFSIQGLSPYSKKQSTPIYIASCNFRI
jgi:hypothetical protein